MKTNLIAAVCENNGIGYANGIPWHSRADMKHFAHMTRGDGRNAVVMGRHTWESLGAKPLPGRLNIVLSRSPIERAVSAPTIESVERVCAQANIETLWVIGGAQIYAEYLRTDKIDECYITRVQGVYECDTFFPVTKSLGRSGAGGAPVLGPEWSSSVVHSSNDLLVERYRRR